MAKQNDLTDFMVKKTKESRGELSEKTKEEEEGLKDAPRSINKEAGVEDSRAMKALATFRYIMRMLFIVPLVAATIILLGIVLLKILPAAVYFVKRFIILIGTVQ